MYTVTFYKGSYKSRQNQANTDRCDVYVEHHFNSSDKPSANYCAVVLADNCSAKSKAIAADYVQRVSSAFGIKAYNGNGLMVVESDGRGNGNLKHTNMPAVLLEPFFCSNPDAAKVLKSEAGQEQLARILMETIKAQFPNGAKVGFSVGHKYKPNSKDMGAAVHGGGREAEYAELILQKCARMLAPSSVVTDGKVSEAVQIKKKAS